jgi:hypothetical protein
MNATRHGLAGATRLLSACCLLGVLIPAQSRAEATADEWKWAATVYVWAPSIGGETAFPPSDSEPPIDVTADKVLNSLNFAFMGAFEGRKGRWALATDLIYLDLGASKKGTRDFGIGHVDIPASVDANLRLDMTGWLWTLDGSYAVVDKGNFSMNALAGVRMLDLKETLGWTFNGDISSLPLQERTGSSQAKDNQWDAIVGLKGRAKFGAGDSWFVPYYVDIGAGESNLTWQGMVGLGYTFDTVEVLGVWRYLDYDLGRSTPIQSIDFNGPALGVTFRF